jgi:hypothetical protein
MSGKWMWRVHQLLREALPKEMALFVLDRVYRGELKALRNGKGLWLVPLPRAKE